MSSTRARKERFIKSFDNRTTRELVMDIFARHGLAMLSDEQVEEITQDLVEDAMSRTKNNIRNRRIYAAQRAAE